MIDDGGCGATGGMKIGRGNQVKVKVKVKVKLSL
jgi:hypothetical protein